MNRRKAKKREGRITGGCLRKEKNEKEVSESGANEKNTKKRNDRTKKGLMEQTKDGNDLDENQGVK